MYKKVDTALDFVEREKEVLEFWKDQEIFKKAGEKNKGKEAFTFFDGPPTANGKPHIGHILTRSIKDLFPRYKAMKGYDVLRKAGWDTHGLPVELEVEKNLNIDGKEQIESYGVEPFVQKCKESVWKYKNEWELMSDRVGYWADMENPYITYDNNYIESVWWSLKEIDKKGLLYKGHKVVPYCPRCGTALSSHEVSQGYKDVVDMTAFVKFKLKEEENTYFVAWTTTPWTLPSNVALCVNPKEEYVYINHEEQILVLAKELAKSVCGVEELDIIKTVKGKDLEKTPYIPLFDFQEGFVKSEFPNKKAWFVTCDDYVTLSDGTGIVHIAPAFGEDDANVGRNYDLPFLQLVNTKGEFVKGCTDIEGMFVKDADKVILKGLKISEKLFKKEPHEHSYPFCWRCHTPLIYYARSTWFIAMTKVRDALVANNQKVNWMPETIKDGRMGNFLDNVIDWGLSRERYWGTPLPVWECECGHFHTVGSIDELCTLGKDVPRDIELHKPFIDGITIKCDKCGKDMKRVKEVIDCWYDSGSMPFAQWHYPFENKEEFERRFPAHFISEAVDQTRGWFYTLLAIGTCVFDTNPFENCIVLGHVLDKEGKKMSKHVGNVVNPWDVLDKQGADAVRWYFYTGSSPWLPTRFFGEAVSEAQRKFMGTLWNTYAFYVMYAEIDGFNPNEYELKDLQPMDAWILSKLNTLVKEVSDNLDNYNIYDTGKLLQSFVDELSNWYIRRCRERFWAKGMEQDKINAFKTLHTVLVTLSKVIAPLTPFIAEMIYSNLVCSLDENAINSVHLCDYPSCDNAMVDAKLEEDMKVVLDIVGLGRAARSNANIKNRQPLTKVMVSGVSSIEEMYKKIICEELNIKGIEFTDDASEYVDYKLKPQLKTLGPKYGKLLGGIRKYLQEVNGREVIDAFNKGENVTFDVQGTMVELSCDDVLVEHTYQEGFAVEQAGGIAVVLDTALNEELIEEGLVREFVSKVQLMRKEAGFEVVDHINITYSDTDLQDVIARNETAIKETLLADSIKMGSEGSFDKELDINGKNIHVFVAKTK